MVDKNFRASCQCPKCRLTEKHVCGTDGKTYINECELKKKSCTTKTNIKVLHNGKCSKLFKPKIIFQTFVGIVPLVQVSSTIFLF